MERIKIIEKLSNHQLKKTLEDFILEETLQCNILGGYKSFNDTTTGDTNSGEPQISDDCDCDPDPIIIIELPPPAAR